MLRKLRRKSSSGLDSEPALKRAKTMVHHEKHSNNNDGKVEIKNEPREQITRCQCVECPELVKNNKIKTLLASSYDQNSKFIINLKKILNSDSHGEYVEEEDDTVKIKTESVTVKTEPRVNAPVIKAEPNDNNDDPNDPSQISKKVSPSVNRTTKEQNTQYKDELKVLARKYQKLKVLYYNVLSVQQNPPLSFDLMKFYTENQGKITESMKRLTKKHPNNHIKEQIFEQFIHGIQQSLDSKHGMPNPVMDVTKPPPMSFSQIKEYYNPVGKYKITIMKESLDKSKLDAKELTRIFTGIQEAAQELNF